MNFTTKALAFLLATLMLVAIIPFSAFAATYTVLLHCGPEGWGSTAYTLYKDSGSNLALYHDKQSVYQNYAMLPGYQTFSDQRTFIEWNTAYNATTGRGSGTSYYDYYTANANTTLYAIWGYNIQFNADGGTFPKPTSGKDIYLTYVASYNLQNQSDPKTDYSYCMPDLFGNTPTKAGCRRVLSQSRPAYALLNSNLTFFCWETPDQNLTIPPTGGYMEWSEFHCANSAKGLAPEFYAIWEPSVTYNANGGSGSMSTDYLTWTGDALWDYNSYTAKSCKFKKSGATFTGWNTKADGSGVAVSVGTQLGGQKNNSDPITLYAQWSDGGNVNPPVETKNYTVTFDPNGGTMVGASSYKINTGDYYSDIFGSMPQATRSGYTLTGWYNEKYGYTLNMNDYFSVAENVTFKAQWTQNAVEDTYATGYYEVTASTLNMRSEPNSSSSRVTYLSKGAQVQITQVSGKWGYCTYNGKSGWISLAYCKYLGNSIGNVTTYTLTLDPNGGTMPSGYKTSYTFEADQRFVDVMGGYPTPTRSGYKFEGWRRTDYTSDFWVGSWGTQPFTFGHDITVKAEWTATHTHSYTSAVTQNATCTSAGVRTYTCSCGDSYTEAIAALGHSYTAKVTAPNCTDKGYTTYTCTVCGSSYVGDYTDAKGHSYNAVVTDPDCTNGGYTTYTCTVCGSSYVGDYTDAKGHSYDEERFAPNCTDKGYTVYTCSVCGDSYTADEVAATGHSYGAWYTTVEPTTEAEGEERRDCANCSAYETNTLPKLEEVVPDDNAPVVTSKNYNIMLTKADDITFIRYAKGTYTTASEIKNAEGCITLSAGKVASFTEDGVCTLTMTDGGLYSVWVKTAEGKEYIYNVDLSYMEQEVSAYGVSITVHNLYGVKDYFIAPGDYNSYSDIKANYIFNITANKIAGAHDYKYIVPGAGRYTVYIRYDDPNRPATVLKVDCVVAEPSFNGNGLQLTLSNLEDVKVVRTAYGIYSKPGDIKRAEGQRSFSGATVMKNGTGNYTIQYRENGTVTVAVVYNHGYEVMYTYEIEKKVPSFVQNGNTVTFGQLDDLNLIRYAKGTYTTSSQIKAAAGSKVVKSDAIVDGFITVTLDKGTYTFCVQYNDESYNYYVVTVE